MGPLYPDGGLSDPVSRAFRERGDRDAVSRCNDATPKNG